MSVKPLAGIKALATHHCVTGSMRYIYEFNQHPISEEMLLGLGAGVGFIYWHTKGSMPRSSGDGPTIPSRVSRVWREHAVKGRGLRSRSIQPAVRRKHRRRCCPCWLRRRTGHDHV